MHHCALGSYLDDIVIMLLISRIVAIRILIKILTLGTS
jgi:hypothetical protein